MCYHINRIPPVLTESSPHAFILCFLKSTFKLISHLHFTSQRYITILLYYVPIDRLCGLVVRVLGYRSGGPGSIPGTTRKKK
jgi:hypothetical protein